MAIGPLDELKTRLTLEGDFTNKAKDAKKAAEDLGAEVNDLSGKADQSGQSFLGFKEHVAQAMVRVVQMNPVLQSLSRSAAQMAAQMGAQLGAALSRVITLLASPAGIAVAAGVATLAIQALSFAAGGAVGVFGSLLTTLGSMAPAILSTFGTVVGPALSLPFIKASAEMDRYRRQFGAIFGGGQQGQQVAKWMQEYGLKSALSQTSLAEMIKTLGLAQLDVARYLPILETFTFLGKGSPDESASDIASIIRRLMGGQTADAFGPEGLGRFGISRKMLEQFGAKFDKGGAFMGTTQEALDVLERLATESPVLKDLRAVMESSTDTRLSNAWDAVQLAITKIGDVLAMTALPVIEKITEWVRNLASNGAVTTIAQKFGSLIGDPDKLKPILAWLITFAERFPSLLRLAAMFVQQMALTMRNMLDSVADALVKIGKIPLPGFREVGAAGYGLKEGLATGDALVTGIEGMFSGEGMMGRAYKKNLELLDNPGDTSDPSLPGGAGQIEDPDAIKNTEHLAAIEKNTRQLVEAQRIILGGGELGRLGVTAVDVFGKGASGSRYGSGSVGHRLTSAIYDAFDEYMAGMRRAGA